MLIYNSDTTHFMLNLRSIDKFNRYNSTKDILKSLACYIYTCKINHKEVENNLSGTRSIDNIVIYYNSLKYKDQFDIRIPYICVARFSWYEEKRRIVTYRKREIVSEKRSQKTSMHYKYMTLFLGWERKFKMYEIYKNI